MMQIVVPAHACYYRKYEIDADIDKSQPVHFTPILALHLRAQHCTPESLVTEASLYREPEQ
jgi:hypothetical protein